MFRGRYNNNFYNMSKQLYYSPFNFDPIYIFLTKKVGVSYRLDAFIEKFVKNHISCHYLYIFLKFGASNKYFLNIIYGNGVHFLKLCQIIYYKKINSNNSDLAKQQKFLN